MKERPRDPRARAALGKYLAARGATRVATVLLEEAQFFGGDSAALARALVPLYGRLGDFKALDSLRPDVLTPAERFRAGWLSRRPPAVTLGDSVVVLSYRPLADGQGLGTVLLRLGRTELPAVIDPRVSGLLLPSVVRKELRTFGTDRGKTLAVAERLRIGGATFSNVPTAMGGPDEKARIGFDVIAPHSPGFDPRKGLMTLRRVERRSQPVAGRRVPALFDANGLRLLLPGLWQPSSAAMPAMLLSTRPWMWDGRRGEVVLLNP